MTLVNYSIKMPKVVYNGTNSLERIPEIVKAVDSKKIAAFTDKGIRSLGLFDLIEKQIKATGVE